ncbi:MAG: hypothetical protein ACFE0I_24000 [Elainellaceae cyanobacterium]
MSTEMTTQKSDLALANGDQKGTLATSNGNGMMAQAGRKLITPVSAYDLDYSVTSSEPGIEVPEDIMAAARAWIEDYKAYLSEQTEMYVERQASAKSQKRTLGLEAGEPSVTIPGCDYVAFDVVTLSPIQFIGLPPYEPGKVIAGGELALQLALVFINPTVDLPCGFAVPPTVQLGGRTLRVRFERIDLTNVANGPDTTFNIVLPNPAPAVVLIPQFFIAPDPGINPQLVEVNVTADIVNAAQPYAAFSTNHVDIDREPPFLFVPGVSPELQHDVPLRYLIYRQ